MPITKSISTFLSLVLVGFTFPAFGQIMNQPASNQLGAEDIFQNPTFVGGITNGGTTAFSEW